ncbi:hypothetical protein GF377_07615, partial [candidate division GN15 bacterium]|nr:hypothetical protein [candidate division GN15 bacterium]
FFVDGPIVTRPKVYLTDKESRNAERILREAGVEGEFVVIHPGSGGSAERWPMERFIELYRYLEKDGVQVVVTGSETEGEHIQAMASKEGVAMKSITGETDLRTLGAVLSKASTVVANSTGPLHLAVAAGTSVVGLYPSRRIMSPKRWGPVGEGHQVIQPTGAKCECPPKQCTCMDQITVRQVANAVRKVYDSARNTRTKN